MTYNTQKSIVVIDDTPENLRLLIELLGEHGYRVRPAPDGELGLNSIRKEPPDLILLDIIMPDMDGFEVCERLKADERTREIPVIFISALNEVFDKVTAFGVGGVDYITKPFQVEEVLARVETHLNLQEMRHQLEIQNQELEAFAHTVAHDLKNPLGTLMGLLNMIEEDTADMDEGFRTLLEIGISSAGKMNNIVDELLLLASVRKEDVQINPINMNDVIKQSLDRLRFMTTEYQPEIFLPDSFPSVVGYAPWIEEVWVNYISNGLKYGGTPPVLEFGADRQGDGMVRFWLKDNGAGLNREERESLFTEFTRLDKIRAQGHGLGLSIVRRIVSKLGGNVGVESERNAGSLFYFSLPELR
ncbi:MAG: hybrid sensor histidine kinase/response regulator [Aggregatilineales bacterium]